MSDKTLKIHPAPDPLAALPLPTTMDIEQSSLDEQKAMTDAFAEQQEKAAKRGSFKAKEAKENERRKLAMDGNFWCCLVFQSREQKNAFLKNAGLEGYGARYLDGRLVAKKFGVPIPEQTVKFQGEKEDAAMTLGFEPIEPFPATLKAKKPTGKSSPGKRKKAVLPKHIQIQLTDGDGGWGAVGDIALLPDGRIEWTDNKRITDSYVRGEYFCGDEQRRLRITEPEKYFATLVRWTGNAYARAIDMDTMAEYVLPQEDAPRKSARPEDILPLQDDEL